MAMHEDNETSWIFLFLLTILNILTTLIILLWDQQSVNNSRFSMSHYGHSDYKIVHYVQFVPVFEIQSECNYVAKVCDIHYMLLITQFLTTQILSILLLP